MNEIKMGVKAQQNNPGLQQQVIHTGTLKDQPILVKTKIDGMEDKLSNLDKIDMVKKEPMIEIDNFQFYDILQECANDLMAQRKLLVNGKEEIVQFVTSYDARNQTFSFGKDINFLNEALNLKLPDLADFLSNFLYTNINTYSFNLFNAIPESLPLASAEVKGFNMVTISTH